MMRRFAGLYILAAAIMAPSPALAAPELVSVPSLSSKSAQQAIAAVAQCATGKKVTLSIVVLDLHGEVIEASRMDGATPVAFRIATRKAKASLLLRQPTVAFDGNEAIKLTLGGMDDFIFIPGGYPLFANGVLVGALGASGAMPVDDDICAKAGQAAIDAGPPVASAK